MDNKEKYYELLKSEVIVREWFPEDIDANSFVESPANETCFTYFSKDEKHDCVNCKNNGHKIFFSIKDEEQRIVTGLVMKSGQWIPRKDADSYGNPGYIYFSRESVRKMQNLFGYNRKLTIHHSDEITGDAMLLDSFLIENQNTTEWHCTYKVLTDKLWTYVKEKRVMGFSVEAFFTPKKLDVLKDNFKSIDNTNVHEITQDDLLDKYKWILGERDACKECRKWARHSEETLEWWIKNALPGVMIGTTITEEISAGSSRFSVGQFNTYCENYCRCHLLMTKKAKKIKK